MNNKDLAKYQKQIDGMMKELTHTYEIDNPEIRLSGEPTEVLSSTSVFSLNNVRKIQEYYGNKIYLDRMELSPMIEFKTLRRVVKKMVDDFKTKHSQSETFFMSFKLPGEAQEWCRQTEIDNLEIRLFCKFEETA